MQAHRTYHTDLLFRHRLGILPSEVKRTIPSSTLSSWKKRNLSKIVGADHAITEENLQLMREFIARKKLLQAAKALWHIFTLFTTLANSVNGFSKTLRKNKTLIVSAIKRISDAITIERACRYFGITTHQYHSWKSRSGCLSSPLHLCRRKKPHQLTSAEATTIKKYFSLPQYLNWSAVSIYYQMLRDQASAMSLATFYKYVNLLQIIRMPLRRKDTRNYSPIRASQPLQILHADVTIFRPLDHSRVYIYLIQCNFSKAILGAVASLRYSAEVALQNLREVCERFSLSGKQVSLITADGSENKGEILEFLARPEINIERLIAQKDIRSSNSMIEAVNKRIKYDFLFPNPPPNYEATVAFLRKAVEEYNNKPLHSLHGLTPNEVLSGKEPNKNWIAEKISKAKHERIAHNQKSNCQICI